MNIWIGHLYGSDIIHNIYGVALIWAGNGMVLIWFIVFTVYFYLS